MDRQNPDDFEQFAAAHGSPGVLGEFVGFLRQNKKWWLLPILLALILFGLLLFLSSSVLAPFIYPLF